MRIGIFTECYKPVMNGVSVSIESFKKGLEENGHEVFVFAPEHKDAVVEHHVYRFPSIADKKGRLYPIFIPSLTLECSYLPEDIISGLDIIHAQHMFTAGRLARYAAEKYKKPLIYTYHTMIEDYAHYLGILAPIARLYLINMSKRFCNSCDQIVAPSESMRKILLHYGVKTPIEVIMTGIEPADFRRKNSEKLRQKFGIHADTKICLYISRIAKEKNLGFLFSAFKKIIQKFPNCVLVMVGGGPEEEWAKKEVSRLGIDKKVFLTGMLPKKEANEIFGMGDVFTFPSYTETQGIVVAEAMAAGTPPVAVNKMGPSDLIHDGNDGFLTKLKQADFIEKVVRLLKDDDLREKFAENGLKRVAEFSNDTSVEKMIKLYERTIDKNGPSRRVPLGATKRTTKL